MKPFYADDYEEQRPACVTADNRLHIRTFTGKKFYWDRPEDNELDIRDIAHALSMNCRWTGHVREFYSVAQHSVFVARHCPTEHWLAGLLHDAAEAYVHDTPTPLKLFLADAGFTAFADLDERVDRAIWTQFGLTWPRHESVKVADQRMLATEHRDLMNGGSVPFEPYDFTITPWSPQRAEAEFLICYHMLAHKEIA